MIEWLGPAAVAAFHVFGPIQRRTETAWARHNAFFVTLPVDTVTLAQGQHPEGRRAQELGENRFQGLVGLIAACGIAFAFEGPVAAFTAFLIAFAVKAMCYSLKFIDIAGHGAEILCAEDDGLRDYREQEARRMLRDPKRQGKTLDEVLADLKRWEWLSKFMRFLAW